MAERKGNPVVSFTISPLEVELIDKYKEVMNIKTRSMAAKRLIRYAMGCYTERSAFDSLPPSAMAEEVRAFAHSVKELAESGLI